MTLQINLRIILFLGLAFESLSSQGQIKFDLLINRIDTLEAINKNKIVEVIKIADIYSRQLNVNTDSAFISYNYSYSENEAVQKFTITILNPKHLYTIKGIEFINSKKVTYKKRRIKTSSYNELVGILKALQKNDIVEFKTKYANHETFSVLIFIYKNNPFYCYAGNNSFPYIFDYYYINKSTKKRMEKIYKNIEIYNKQF